MSRQENITATEVLIALAIMGLLLWGLATILWHPADAQGGNASAGYSVEAPVDARAPGVAGTAGSYWYAILEGQPVLGACASA
jgi:hypothetical protein